MKKILGLMLVVLFIVTSSIPVVLSNQELLLRGSFYAQLGLQDQQDPQLALNGTFSEIRNRHIVLGTATLLGSERTFRFQGIISRHAFLIQSALRSHLVRIIGVFTQYDETTHTFSGQWRGVIPGYGYAQGWIEATFT